MKNFSKCQEAMITQQKNLLDNLHHQKRYKLNCTDLSRQANMIIFQQINFIEKDDSVTMYFIAEKQQKMF